MEEQVARILSLLLGQEFTSNDDVSKENQDLWDSMKHIEIITTLEEELKISFNIEDIPKLTSMKKIIEAIKNLD
ncbi:acyl carrier protein [bacterium]|nr:acyl carrier protein [bacterium]